MAGKQKRDKRGRFKAGASEGFASSRLAEFGKHVAKRAGKAAAIAGASYVAGKAIDRLRKRDG